MDTAPDMPKTKPITVEPQKQYPGENTSGQEIYEMGMEIGIIIDPEAGLTLPDVRTEESTEKLLSKIAGSLTEVQSRIREEKQKGKHIIYVPGSYDLTHKGHAFYVEQVLECYLAAANCKREDVFVVMLADSDKLISNVKASKYIENGGTELNRRPVEPAHERVVGMASLNVDLVGILPSPEDNRELFPAPVNLDIDQMLAELEGEDIPEKDKVDLINGLLAYKALYTNLIEGKDLGKVPVQAWQLYTTTVINQATGDKSGLNSFEAGRTTRLVSHDDTKYLHQVKFLMKYADVGVSVIKDINNGSTSTLLENAQGQHGVKAWEEIRNFKRQQILALMGQEAAERLDRVNEKVKAMLNLE